MSSVQTSEASLERWLANPQETIRQLDRLDCEESLSDFVRHSWPHLGVGKTLHWNWHLDYICEYLEAVKSREITRLIINIPPRHMKSLLTCVFFPAWVWTTEPNHQFLSVTNARDLALRDALRTRRLITTPWYQSLWPTEMRADQNAKGRYETAQGGVRASFGFDSSILGQDADTILIDDPHDTEGAQSEAERQAVLDKYDNEVSGRLNDPETGAIVLIMQRLHEVDLSGHLLHGAADEHWEHLCLPAEYEPKRYSSSLGLDDPRTKPGQLLWPERFTGGYIEGRKARLGPYGASGQLQQRPSPGEGAVLKRTHWKDWPVGKPLPECEYIVQSYDTAFEEKEESDYSARTTWGAFRYDEVSGTVGEGRWNVILLERWQDRVSFPRLKSEARAGVKRWEPDIILVEPKASGKSLIQELAQSGIYAHEARLTRSKTTGKEMDKVARAHVANAVLYGGAVWKPLTGKSGKELQWPLDVVEQCAAFPKGEHDDLVDTCVIAWLWLRRLWMVEAADDPEEDDEEPPLPKRPVYG